MGHEGRQPLAMVGAVWKSRLCYSCQRHDLLTPACDCRPGYASVFTLHCSLQPASSKMFVHAREADAPSNMKYMGLIVDKYVPDLGRCKQSTWAGAAKLSA